MSYVESNLMPGETVLATGKVHWLGYLRGASVAGLGLLVLLLSDMRWLDWLGWAILVTGLVLLLNAWVYVTSTELAITDKRLIAKSGLIRRRTVELLHRQVESINVDQGILGRVLDFGTLGINGTGGARMPIPQVAAPLTFRREVMIAIEATMQ